MQPPEERMERVITVFFSETAMNHPWELTDKRRRRFVGSMVSDNQLKREPPVVVFDRGSRWYPLPFLNRAVSRPT